MVGTVVALVFPTDFVILSLLSDPLLYESLSVRVASVV